MAVDLGDLIEMVQSEVDAPGEDSFPNATDDDWLNNLRSAFWEAVLDGVISPSKYTEDEGSITPIDVTDPDLSREMQQLIVLYAGVRVIRNKIRTMNTVFRTKAGPVEFETQQSANVFKTILDELVRRRNLILTRLSDVGAANSYYIDMVLARDDAMSFGDVTWVNY